MQLNTLPWTLKYQPTTLAQFSFLTDQIQKMQFFVSNFKKQKKKALLLHGPTGTGKTAVVHALARDCNYELIEINASDVRNKDAVLSLIGSAAKQMSLFSSGKIILVDEVDGLSGHQDRGGLGAIEEVIETTAFPIIMTCHDASDKKMKGLLKVAQPLVFPPLDYTAITEILKHICDKEKILYEETALKTLARQAAGDIRAAINDLQALAAQTKEKITLQQLEELGFRNKQQAIEDALLKVFKIKDATIALQAYENVSEDLDQIALWVDENLPKEYTAPEALARAYEALSRADVFRGRIRRWQHWGFLVYVNALLSAGVAVSKTERNKNQIAYEQTKRILQLWIAKQKYAKRQAISQKIAAQIHSSPRYVIQHMLPYVKHIFQHNKEMSAKISEDLELEEEEVQWLRQ